MNQEQDVMPKPEVHEKYNSPLEASGGGSNPLGAIGAMGGTRMTSPSGKAALRDLIVRLRIMSDSLDDLSKSLPEELPPGAGQGLRTLVKVASRIFEYTA